MKRNEQKEMRRKQIVVAAVDLFIQKGFAATKISDIAQAAGMSVGLMFHYFDSKEQLYKTLVKQGIEKSQNMLQSYNGEPLEFFEGTAKLIIDQVQKELFVSKMFVLMDQAANNDILDEETRRQLKRSNIEKSAKIIEAGQKAGTIREGDPIALSVSFWSAILGICKVILTDPELPCPDSSWIVDILRNDNGGIN